MKPIMENWRRFVAEEEQEELIEEGRLSKLLGALAMVGGLGISTAAEAGGGLSDAATIAKSIKVMQDAGFNAEAQDLSDATNNGQEGLTSADWSQELDPNTKAALLHMLKAKPAPDSAPSADSAPDAPTPQTTVTQRQASSGIGELSQFIMASSGDLEAKRAKLKKAQEAGATALHGVDIDDLDKAAAQVLIDKAMGK